MSDLTPAPRVLGWRVVCRCPRCVRKSHLADIPVSVFRSDEEDVARAFVKENSQWRLRRRVAAEVRHA